MKAILFLSAALMIVLPVMVLTPTRAESIIDAPVEVKAEQPAEKA